MAQISLCTLLGWLWCLKRLKCCSYGYHRVRNLSFSTFDLDMWFAPQRRALFRHLHVKKRSGVGVVYTFWLANVLHATTACTVSTSQLSKVVRRWFGLYVLTWKCASHHNGVHFFDISTSKSGPRMVCFLHFDLDMCFTPQRRARFRHRNFQKWSGVGVAYTFWLGNVLHATTACTVSTSQLLKVVREWCAYKCASRHDGVHFFDISTSKSGPALVWLIHFDLECASRHNGVHFFDISTSKNGPALVWLIHFDLEMCFTPQRRALFRHLNFQKWSGVGVAYTFWLGMCFAPQRRALFRHLNFQKWSGVGVAYTFWLGNVLHATTACTVSTSQLSKVVREWCALYILTCKCASRHNGMQFCISHLASWLRTRRFSEPSFRPSGAPSHWKNTVNRDSPFFSRTCIFLLPTLSLLWSSHFLTSPPWLFAPLLFHLSILSEVWLLNFLRSLALLIWSVLYRHKYTGFAWWLFHFRNGNQPERITAKNSLLSRLQTKYSRAVPNLRPCLEVHHKDYIFDINTSGRMLRTRPWRVFCVHVPSLALQRRLKSRYWRCHPWSLARWSPDPVDPGKVIQR